MNSKQRVRAVLSGEQPDRLPVSVWGHDFLREWSASDLAQQTIETQRAYGYDLVKINPRWTLFAEPWGNRYEPPSEQRFPKLLHRVVTDAESLNALEPVDPTHPVLNEHVEAVRLVTSEIGDEVDCIATLFSPLSILGLLAGGVGKPLTGLLVSEPDASHRALDHITGTLEAHARALIGAGAAGLFFAPLQWTSLDVCDAEAYESFGKPYDLRVLDAVQKAPVNVLHVCGDNIGMPRFYNYPVAVLNWDNFGNGNPSLAEVANACDKVVAGGIAHRKLHKLDAQTLETLAEQALAGTTNRVMLTGGCGIGALTPAPARRAVVVARDALASAG